MDIAKDIYKVSIIITSYNLGDFLMQTVDSVLAQTYKNTEIIIVDDGSDDSVTSNVLKKLSKNPKLNIIQIKNSGVSIARNLGAEASSGQYLVFLDGDDIISPEFVEKCICIFKINQDAELVYCVSKLFGEANRIRPLGRPKYKKLLIYNNYFPVTCMIKRERFLSVKGFNGKMRSGIEDWEFFIRYCYKGMVVYRLNCIMFYYRIRPQSRTKKVNSSIKCTLQMRLEILSNNIEIYSKYRDSLKKHCLVIEEKNSIRTNIKKIIYLLNILVALVFHAGKAERFIM